MTIKVYIWEEVVVVYFIPSQLWHGVSTENYEHVSQDSRNPSRDLNPAIPEHYCPLLLLHQSVR
jgi:hypothetical protein